jgi:hypothetical protein
MPGDMHAGALGAAGKRLVRKKFTEKQPATSPIDGTKALPKRVQMRAVGHRNGFPTHAVSICQALQLNV